MQGPMQGNHTISVDSARVPRIEMREPYLLFIGEEQLDVYAKTAIGIVQWRRDKVAGQLRLSAQAIDLGVPDMDIPAAVAAGVGSLVIGVAPVGGSIPDEWWRVIADAVNAGLDVVSGLHTRICGHPELDAAALASGARLIDIRVPPSNIVVGKGVKRSGQRVLMIGTDCAVGKKYTALALHAALQRAGVKTTFRATGQTGIMLAGEGMPIDSVVSDFVSGAAEALSPDNDDDHWDVIEGQGSLFHPGYAAVNLGLLHGSQPDAVVLCHDAMRTHHAGWPDFALPTIRECIDLNLQMARRTNPDAFCVGLSINTSRLAANERRDYLANLAAEFGLPCIDPVIDGGDRIATQLLTGSNR